jgi:hypothetical protein
MAQEVAHDIKNYQARGLPAKKNRRSKRFETVSR